MKYGNFDKVCSFSHISRSLKPILYIVFENILYHILCFLIDKCRRIWYHITCTRRVSLFGAFTPIDDDMKRHPEKYIYDHQGEHQCIQSKKETAKL